MAGSKKDMKHIEELAEKLCVKELWQGQEMSALRMALHRQAKEKLNKKIPKRMLKRGSGAPFYNTSPRVHAFEYAKNHGISIEEEIRYFTTVLRVLEHMKCKVESSTRRGVYQLVIAHIDHPTVVKMMDVNPEYVDILTTFLEVSTKRLDEEFQKILTMPKEEKQVNMKLHEDECGMIMASYGNFLGSPIKISDDNLEKIIALFPYMDQWREYWNDYMYSSVKSLPFGVWANMTRDARRCFIICHVYEKEMLALIKSIGKQKYHSDLKSLIFTLNNISMTKVGRQKFLHDPETLELLASYINMEDCGEEVRKFLVTTFLHIALDTEIHETILDPERDILGMILRPITGYGSFSDDEIMELPNIVCSNILSDPQLARHKNEETRHAVLQFLWNMSSSKTSREKLRDQGIYFLLRELHCWEYDRIPECEDESHSTSDDYLHSLEGIIQVMIHTEEELHESGEDESLKKHHPEPEIGDISRFLKPQAASQAFKLNPEAAEFRPTFSSGAANPAGNSDQPIKTE